MKIELFWSQFMKHHMTWIFCILSILTLTVACGTAPSPQDLSDSSENTADEELSPYSPQVIYATQWSEVMIQSNFAKTTISVGAHFSTTRNACGRDAYGAIPLNSWNELAEALNQAVNTSLSEEYCMPEAQELDQNGYIKKHIDGSVQIKLESKKMLELFQAKDGMICTQLQDRKLAEKLHRSLNTQVIRADQEDCPHGWGSN